MMIKGCPLFFLVAAPLSMTPSGDGPTSVSPAQAAQTTVAALESRTDWPGHFSVVELGRVRMTPLPTKP